MKHISISGAGAVGKTTLLKRLLERYGDRAIAREERPQDNPFMEDYYADPKRWAFHCQTAFLTLYLDSAKQRGEEREFCFYDRCLIENLVIARYRLEMGDLSRAEFDVLESLAEGIAALMPPIDRYIYLRCSAKLMLERFRQRGREYESEVGRSLVEGQKRLYDDWAETLPKAKLLIVDVDEGIDLDEIACFIET